MYNNYFANPGGSPYGATFQPNAIAVISTVHGKDVALSYPSQIGSTSYFLDDSEPYLYKKRVDNNGNVVEFRTFELTEKIEEAPKPVDTNSFATKDDIAGIYSAIEELKKSMTQRPNTYQGKKGNSHESSTR